MRESLERWALRRLARALALRNATPAALFLFLLLFFRARLSVRGGLCACESGGGGCVAEGRRRRRRRELARSPLFFALSQRSGSLSAAVCAGGPASARHRRASQPRLKLGSRRLQRDAPATGNCTRRAPLDSGARRATSAPASQLRSQALAVEEKEREKKEEEEEEERANKGSRAGTNEGRKAGARGSGGFESHTWG